MKITKKGNSPEEKHYYEHCSGPTKSNPILKIESKPVHQHAWGYCGYVRTGIVHFGRRKP